MFAFEDVADGSDCGCQSEVFVPNKVDFIDLEFRAVCHRCHREREAVMLGNEDLVNGYCYGLIGFGFWIGFGYSLANTA